MDPGSLFLLLIIVVVLIGGGFFLFGGFARLSAMRSHRSGDRRLGTGGEDAEQRPRHTEVETEQNVEFVSGERER